MDGGDEDDKNWGRDSINNKQMNEYDLREMIDIA